MIRRYEVRGPVRGLVSTHRTREAAERALERDKRACAKLGGGAYSDASVREVEVDPPRRGPEIVIISGEGTGPGTIEAFTGKRTALAVWKRIDRERANGQRWAFARVDGTRCDSVEDLELHLPGRTPSAASSGVRLHRDGTISYRDRAGKMQHRIDARRLGEAEFRYVLAQPGGDRIHWWVLVDTTHVHWPGLIQPQARYTSDLEALRDAHRIVIAHAAKHGTGGPQFNVEQRIWGDA